MGLGAKLADLRTCIFITSWLEHFAGTQYKCLAKSLSSLPIFVPSSVVDKITLIIEHFIFLVPIFWIILLQGFSMLLVRYGLLLKWDNSVNAFRRLLESLLEIFLGIRIFWVLLLVGGVFLVFCFHLILCSIFRNSASGGWTESCLVVESYWSIVLLVFLLWAWFLRVSHEFLRGKGHASKVWAEAKRLWTHLHHLSSKIHAWIWGCHHTSWSHTVRSMNHASCNCLLLLVISFFLWALGDFSHLLKMQKAAKGISMSLSLHHSQSLLVVRTLSMHWARSDQHLLSLVAHEALHVLLILNLLKLLEGMMLVVHHLLHLYIVARHQIWVLAQFLISLLWRLLSKWNLWNLLLTVNVVGFDLEVFLLILSILVGITSSWTTENAILSGTCSLVWGNELVGLVTEGINASILWLIIGNSVLLTNTFCLSGQHLYILLLVKLTSLSLVHLSLTNSTGETALSCLLVVGTWVAESTTETIWKSSSWKFEQLLTERWNMGQFLMGSSFTFLMALVKYTVGSFSNFWANIFCLIMPWSSDICGYLSIKLTWGGLSMVHSPAHGTGICICAAFQSLTLGHWGLSASYYLAWFLNIS